MSTYHTRPPGGSPPPDWPAIARLAVPILLGDPNSGLSNERELRWGNRGSFALDLKTGCWRDYEAGTSGGIIELVQRETGRDRSGAIEWLVENKLLERWPVGRPSPSKGAAPAPKAKHQKPPPQTSSWKIHAVRALWQASEPVPLDPAHPARMWMAERHLWRSEFPVPHAVRWVPADAKPFRGLHLGAGSIIIPHASPAAWVEAWPLVPLPTAVSLVSIDAGGQPALDRPEDHRLPDGGLSRGLSKRTLGTMKGALVIIGNPVIGDTTQPLREAEGLADALGVAARRSGPVMAPIGTPARVASDDPLLEWISTWALRHQVHLLVDRDEPGQRAGGSLRRALLERGVPLQRISVYTPPDGMGKDPADASRNLPFPPLADGWESYAKTLRDMYGLWPRWEVARVADAETTDWEVEE